MGASGGTLAHPFDDGTAAVPDRSIKTTAFQFGKDESIYERLMLPIVARWKDVTSEILGPLHFPRHVLVAARFALLALWSVSAVCRLMFRNDVLRNLFAGIGAHSALPLESPG
jgi:phytoene dehydrogenase-like protein